MKIKCIGSGSSGNCFLLFQNNETVVLECGFKYETIASAIIDERLSLNSIVGVLVSHAHKDHSKSLNDFQSYGFNIYCPETLNFESYPNVNFIEDKKQFKISSWLEVLPFRAKHDTECFGYILHDLIDDEVVLFLTDTAPFEFGYNFLDFDRVLIECNHMRKALDKRLLETNDFKYKRQGAYHLSLGCCKRMLKAMNLSKCKEIDLIHFSQELGYPDICQKDIYKTFKIKTYVM